MPNQIEIHTLLRKLIPAIYTVLREADIDIVRGGVPPVDAHDRRWIVDLSEDVKTSVLDDLERATGRRVPRESISGGAQTPADVSAHDRISTILRGLLPECVVCGEEAGSTHWDRWDLAKVGVAIFSVDAIDGTGPFDTLGFGHSSNLLFFVRMPDGSDHLLMSLTVTATGWALAWLQPGEVYLGVVRGRRLQQWRPLTEPLQSYEDVRRGSVAVVGAKPEQRERIEALLATHVGGWGLPPSRRRDGSIDLDPSLTVYTLGGAPAAVGLAALKLDALVIPDAQTLHDTAPIPALLALGMIAIGADGREIPRLGLMEKFNLLGRPKGEHYLPIPQMVLTRTPDLGHRIAARLFGGGGAPSGLRLVTESST